MDGFFDVFDDDEVGVVEDAHSVYQRALERGQRHGDYLTHLRNAEAQLYGAPGKRVLKLNPKLPMKDDEKFIQWRREFITAGKLLWELICRAVSSTQNSSTDSQDAVRPHEREKSWLLLASVAHSASAPGVARSLARARSSHDSAAGAAQS